MKILFWGVRGSIPVAGCETVKYGGNSSCVEVRTEGADPLVLDCGSGARPLGRWLLGQPQRRLDLLLTHFHIDHVLGYPFFGPMFSPSYRIHVYAPASDDGEIKKHLGSFLNGVFHPLHPTDVPARVEYTAIRVGQGFLAGIYDVVPVLLNHPGGACGYRITQGNRTFCYFTDSCPLDGVGRGVMADEVPTPREKVVIDAMRGTDLVIFDTMFTLSSYRGRETWGHSFPEYAVKLCERARVPLLYLFHHAPEATDKDLDELQAVWADHMCPRVRIAMEGDLVDLEG